MQLGNKEKDIGAFWRDPSAGFLLFLLQPGKGSNLYMVLLPREAHWRLSIQSSYCWSRRHPLSSVYQNFRLPGRKRVSA